LLSFWPLIVAVPVPSNSNGGTYSTSAMVHASWSGLDINVLFVNNGLASSGNIDMNTGAVIVPA
jgi:hypothetical protein